MHISRLTPASFRRFPWKNGGGVTIDIAEHREPGSALGGWDGVIWRLGRTTISVPAPFSDLSGFDRCQVVVSGRGLVLDTPEGEVDLRKPFRPVRYRGEAPIVSRLENGPVEVVNLIADRQRAAIRLDVLQAGDQLALTADTAMIYAPTGASQIMAVDQPCTIGADHAVRIDTPAGPLECRSGLILVASISRRATARQ
jgi:environmental stress-induced protein Ves